jgi:predicted HTH transcriptional regulator
VLIEDGESQTTEFKSTLRTDVKGNDMPTSAVEYQCLKAVNGFLNSPQGGTLLIGVEDDGSIYGLEEDYETFRENQKQEVFRRHLYDVIGSSMEDRFNDFIDISFVTLEDREICVVNVDQGPRPAYLEHQGEQEFYVRQGNRTIPLEPKQQAEYINDEFEDD